MKLNRKKTGYYGEELACKALEKRGYRLLQKNFTVHGGELDLIMAKGEELIFVEVKTRRDESYGTALESITPQKKRHLIHAAKVYLCGKEDRDYDVRFFAVTITLSADDTVIKTEVFEDIFN